MKGRVRVGYRTYAGRSWRSRLAWALRSAADRLDNYASVGLLVQTEPRLDGEQINKAFDLAIEYFGERLAGEVDHEVTECVMRISVPWTRL